MTTTLRIVALVLGVLGLIALAMGGNFTWTESHDLGPLIVNERQTYNYPVWTGVALLLLGAGMFGISFTTGRRVGKV